MEATDRRVPSLFIIPLSLAFVGLLLFIALLYGQQDLAILSLILFGIVAGVKLWTRWSLAGIDCRVNVDKRRGFPGETLMLKATAENRKFLPVWLQVKVPISGLAQAVSHETTVMAETSLLWYQRADFEWELAAERRGVHHMGPLRIVSGDLFGFFPRVRETAEILEVIVYPRLVPLRSFPLPRRDFFGIPGAESPVQDPVYILGTREYQHGRPAKYIHWKATARHHRLQEKIFEPTAQEKILLVVDVGEFVQQKAEAEFEHALETVASVAVWLDEQGCAVGLVTNGLMTGGGPPIVPVTRNPQQLTCLLEALARLQMEPAQGLIDMIRLHVSLPWGLSCLYFTLTEESGARAAREYFTHRRTPMVLFVSRPVPTSTEDSVAVGRRNSKS
jgi:uncharacterized protein (DUF58 family)